MSENKIRELTIDDIRPLVQPDYMTRGLEVFDQNLVSVTSRYGNKLFANVSGSGSNPYRVSVIFDQQIKATCTCPAARRTPFCKHATAVLLFRLLQAADRPQLGKHLLRGLLADVAGVEDHQVGAVRPLRLGIAERRHQFGHPGRIVDVHLTAVCFDKQSLGHG